MDRPPTALSSSKDVVSERMTMLELSGSGKLFCFHTIEIIALVR